MTLTFGQSGDDNGVAISSYELWIDAGNDLSSAFTIVASYGGTATTHILDTTTDSLTTGQYYRVKYRAKNANNQYSDYSDGLLFAFGPVPNTPATPTKTIASSTWNSIAIAWAKNTGDTLPLTGYKLYADSGRNDDYTLVYDGTNSPEVAEYIFPNADSNLTYRFYLTAVNFNGESTASGILSAIPCSTPSGMPTPTATTVTQTAIGIEWNPPSNDGGCEITGYKIYIDDGAGGAFTEHDAANVNNKPFLNSYSVTVGTPTLGNTYKLKVTAVNKVDVVESDTISVILASVPDTPAVPTSTSDGYDLIVTMTAPASNGGSAIISYQLDV